MAERRMFTQKITESDAFLEMPPSSQALYFHLCMNADDDGFVNNPKRVQRMIGACEDDQKLLIAKAFTIPFENGVIVIKHWRMHNLLRKDRYKETDYKYEKSQLYIKENGAYTLDVNQGVSALATKWQPDDNQVAPQDSIGKVSIVKESICKENTKEKRAAFRPPSFEEVTTYCEERQNEVDAQRFIDFYIMKGWYVGKNKMKDWKAAVRTWEKDDKQKQSFESKRERPSMERNYSPEDIKNICRDISNFDSIDL